MSADMLMSFVIWMNKPWLKLILPVLVVIFGFGLMGNSSLGHASQHSFSHLQHAKNATVSQPSRKRLPVSEQPANQKPHEPLSLPTALLENTNEDADHSFKGLFALIGLVLLYWSALFLQRYSFLNKASLFQADFNPFAVLKQTPLFIQIQVFRL